MIDIAKILFIVAQNDFRDEEYFIPKAVLEKDNEIETASITDQKEAVSKEGKKVRPEKSLAKALDMLKIYDCIVFVGGPGAQTFFENEYALNIAARASEEDKLLAAICIAPMVLANAGVLEGKMFTAYESIVDSVKAKGAKHENKPVVVDENIITANGPAAAKEFGETIAKTLKEGPKLQGEIEEPEEVE